VFRRVVLAIAAATLLPCLVSAEVSGTPRSAKRLKIAVTEIKVLYGDPQLEALLSEVALTEAASFKTIDTIGRSDIKTLLGLERQKQLLGCSEDSSCLAELGGALGVDFVLVGTVGRIGALLRLDLKLIDGKRARVIGRAGTSVQEGAERLVEATQNGVRALLQGVAPGEPAVARNGGPARWPGWVAIGVGGATLAAGLATTVMARSRYEDLKASRLDPGYADTYASDAARVRRLSVLSDVLVPVGAVTLGVGGWLWWRSRPAPPVQLKVTAGPQQAGATLAWGF
jgi:TolB-like protein